ncbi:MAG: hypothetical protein AAFN10_21565, partial [Bacteroidota bacterium]
LSSYPFSFLYPLIWIGVLSENPLPGILSLETCKKYILNKLTVSERAMVEQLVLQDDINRLFLEETKNYINNRGIEAFEDLLLNGPPQKKGEDFLKVLQSKLEDTKKKTGS